MLTPAPTSLERDSDRMIINLGPSHNSTHGTLHIILELEGEFIQKATPVIGYLHRGVEKLGENLSYAQFIPLTDRLNYCSSLQNNVGYCHAVEKLLGIELTPRCKYIRVIISELARISDHLLSTGAMGLDTGALCPCAVGRTSPTRSPTPAAHTRRSLSPTLPRPRVVRP